MIPKPDPSDRYLQEAIKAIRDGAIEECALVAEAHHERFCGKVIDRIAAAIRALKDKP